MANLTQANRMAVLKTPLGEDVLALKDFSGAEGLGELFEFQVDAFSEQKSIDFDDALGKSCTVKLKTYQGKERFFCGVLAHAQWAGVERQYFNYRLTLRPWFWLLAHRANCRIFLGMDVKQIIEKVFTDAEFSNGTDFRFETHGDYDKIEYCVQYRESDFAFVSRLMEQYGIYYFFEHSDDRHTMVLADSLSSHKTIENLPQVPFHYARAEFKRIEQQLNEWTSDRRFRSGKIVYNDYDYLKPPKNLEAPYEAPKRGKFEVYDYPGKYTEQEKGKQFAQFRLEAEQAVDKRRMAFGDAPSLFPGGLVEVGEHPVSGENQQYLVVRASHRFGTQYYASTGGLQDAPGYSGSYEFLPNRCQFRSLPLTPKPRIYGIQTARVVVKKGEDGEEISTDEHGRIWVKFHWDREPQKTCPIRVAQVWSGKQWGGQFIPRVDMEVVVEFLEGDPDRPLVTGCVYNGDNKYPYKLPDNKTQSGLKSDSSKGHDGYNELMFEDKKGSELVQFHAEKDLDSVIEHNETRKVGNDQTLTVESNQTETIQQNRSVTVMMNDSLTVDLNRSVTVMATDTLTATASITLICGASSITLLPSSILINSPSIIITGPTVMSGPGTIGPPPLAVPIT
jgi:type VI secretion system secreted protein VgrG